MIIFLYKISFKKFFKKSMINTWGQDRKNRSLVTNGEIAFF